jgi:hypothetical protein
LEDVSQAGAGDRLQLARKREIRSGAQQQLRPLAGAVRRREEKDAWAGKRLSPSGR